jgi:hypothetical protein
VLPAVRRPTLGPGEREASCLALEVIASAILLDDDPARKLAGQLELSVVGTAGVLVLAKERQLISNVRPCLDALIKPFLPGTPCVRADSPASWGNVKSEDCIRIVGRILPASQLVDCVSLHGFFRQDPAWCGDQ